LSNILLIEDDLEVQTLICDYLKRFGYKVTSATKPLEALEILEKERFDLIILDLMLPQMDGFDLFKKIKKKVDIPIIISSARGDIGNKILGFELGADDYLAKPYEPRELILRIEAVLRRVKQPSCLKVRDFVIDEKNFSVYLKDYPIDFTPIEFEIFLTLAKNRGKPLSRDQLIHSTSLPPDTRHRSVDMHICNIRQKIGDDPKNPTYIKSVWGIGYKFL